MGCWTEPRSVAQSDVQLSMNEWIQLEQVGRTEEERERKTEREIRRKVAWDNRGRRNECVMKKKLETKNKRN